MKSNGVEPIYGDLPQEWQMVSLGFLIDSNKAELATGPFGTMLQASEYRPTGTPVVAVQHIGENRLKHVDLPRVDDETAERLQRYKLKLGDIVFGRKGSVERRAIIRKEEAGWLEGSDCIRLRFLDEEISPEFVSYVLGSAAFKDWIMRHAGGATMPSLNQSILKLLPLPLPPLPEQRAIARILGALDDKIELNRRMNHTLEEMARALFKSWFVDFDPVAAKAEGRVPYGMNAETASLFPAEFEETEEGVIPKGWKVGTAGDMATIVGGTTPSTSKNEYWDEGTIAWATPKDLAGLSHPVLLDTDRKITPEGLKQISSGLLPAGTLLISSRAPIGYLAISEISVAINQGFMAMHCDKGFSNYYVIQWLRENMENIISHANGTTFLEISKSSFRLIPAILPSEHILEKFSESAEKLHKKIVSNVKEIQALATIRDTLLPKLMSGEVRVKG